MATANDAMATAIFRMRFCAIISTSSFGVVDTAAADTDDDAVLSLVAAENRLVPVLLLSPSSFSLVDGMYGTDSPKLLLVDVDASPASDGVSAPSPLANKLFAKDHCSLHVIETQRSTCCRA